MIQIIKHRCNTVESLKSCALHWGVEIDLRSNLNNHTDLHLSHDPWIEGESFRKWLEEFSKLKIKGPLILNTKEDGLEKSILDLLNEFSISNYIFLDTTIPTLKKWTREFKNPNFFIRSSSLEPIEFVMIHKGFCNWVWIDCFDKIAPNNSLVKNLSAHFKTCLVSPELQGGSEDDIKRFLDLSKFGLFAVCTKKPELWETFN